MRTRVRTVAAGVLVVMVSPVASGWFKFERDTEDMLLFQFEQQGEW